VPGLITTVISCEQRTVARGLTVPQLVRAGLTPIVILSPCLPAGAEGNAAATREALKLARDAGGDLLFCEDDIDLAKDFPAALALARTVTNRVVYLYAHDAASRMHRVYGVPLAQRIRNAQPIPTGLYPAFADVMGGQCVYLPRAVVRRTPDPHRLPCDQLFAAVARDAGALIRLPHAAQHRADRTARPPADNAGRTSRSYDLPRMEG